MILSTRTRPRALLYLLLFFAHCVFAEAARADEPPTDDPRWSQAQEAYGDGHDDQGHALLIALADDHPGDLDLAVTCYATILAEEGNLATSNPWIDLASEQLVALEQLGAISANTVTMREAVRRVVDRLLLEGRYLEARDTTDRLQRQNQHDLYWRVRRAHNYRRMDLSESRKLYLALKEDLDLDHPDAYTRELWAWMNQELKTLDGLPQPVYPLPKGTPLVLMTPDDPDGHWRSVLDRSPAEVPRQVDHLIAVAGDQVVPWQDESGLTDPLRALDLHLRSKPANELEALRKIQDERFARETISSNPTEAELLKLSRRYPWSAAMHKKLLLLGNEALWDGRGESALRSFHELLIHADDRNLQDAAQVGYWTALKLVGAADELRALANAIDPGKDYPWMGKTARGAFIRSELLKGLQEPVTPEVAPLTTMPRQVLRLPPVSPWPTDTPAIGFGIDLQAAHGQIIASGRNLLVSYDAEDPAEPRWSQLHPHPIEHHRRTGYHPGYFRPLIRDGVLHTRWGLSSLPNGIAAFALADGRPLWSHVYSRGNSPYAHGVPMGDPVSADDSLFYLQWHTRGDVNDRNRAVSLINFDLRKHRPRWSADLVTAGKSSDFSGRMQGAAPQNAIYGNAVTVHRGAVYANTNAGIIVRCDVRDGRVDWIHHYRRVNSNLVPQNLGAAPIVSGNNIICMPRDDGRIFALDRETGRLVWDNPLVIGTEAIGVHEGILVVRGVGVVAGLDLGTGKARWFRPLSDRLLGRALLRGGSLFLGTVSDVQRLDARTGHLLERRPWDLGKRDLSGSPWSITSSTSSATTPPRTDAMTSANRWRGSSRPPLPWLFRSSAPGA